MLSSFFRPLLSVILPFTCAHCHKIIQERGLCPECFKNFFYITDPMCRYCGHPLDPLIYQNVCIDCQFQTPAFNIHRSVWVYSPYSRRLILQFKHGNQQWLCPFFAYMLLIQFLKLPFQYNGIVPVPLHWKRLAHRGFNQSALLAYQLSRHTGIPVWLDGLKRKRETPSQGTKSRVKRQENVKDAFEIGSLFISRETRILLIDDVFTTGATLQECSHVLKQAGVENVGALTLTKIIPEEKIEVLDRNSHL